MIDDKAIESWRERRGKEYATGPTGIYIDHMDEDFQAGARECAEVERLLGRIPTSTTSEYVAAPKAAYPPLLHWAIFLALKVNSPPSSTRRWNNRKRG